MKLPIPADEFDHHDYAQHKAMYEHFGSSPKLGHYLRSNGVKIADHTLQKWRAQLGIPVYQEAHRERSDIKDAVEEQVKPEGLDDFALEVKRYLERRKTQVDLEAVCDHFSVPPRDVRAALEKLEAEAVMVKITDGSVGLEPELEPAYEPKVLNYRQYAEEWVPYGVTADNHIGSKYERMDVLETLFDRWADEGVKHVYQCGNIIDGEKYGINLSDIYAHGFEDQCENVVEKWPKREGMTTHFITGACHEGWYIKKDKINVGKRIEQTARDAGRDDLRFLGHLEHDLRFEGEEESAEIRLFHAGGGSAYATSYKPQKIVESYQGGEKPDALLIGHFHKYDTGYPREVYEAQCGCTQDQTPWMRSKNIAAHVGGLILWMRQNSQGLITGWRVEWLPFYDRKFYQFRW